MPPSACFGGLIFADMADRSTLLLPVRRASWGGMVMFVLLLLFCVLAVKESVSLIQHRERKANALITLENQRQRLVMPPAKATIEEQRRWDQLAVERSFDWTRIFDAVGASVTTNIELLEFVPDRNANAVILKGEARDYDSLASCLANLRNQAVFVRVYLIRQQRSKHERMETIAFEIRAHLSIDDEEPKRAP